MRSVRPIVLVAASMAACVQLAPSPSVAASAELARTFRHEVGAPEIRIEVAGADNAVQARVASALADEHFTVTSSQSNLVEAAGPTSADIKNLRVVVRALLAPAPVPGNVRVRLSGDRILDNFGNGEADRSPIDPTMYGIAGDAWVSLLKVAAALQPDSAKRTVILPPP